MTYEETIHYLYTQLPQFQRIGAAAYKPGLENIILLDEYYGCPHRNYPCLHVAGTNGKGSVSHLFASILQAAGYKVGLFTSPHLKDFRERIRVNGQTIPSEAVCRFTEDFIHSPLAQREDFQPSFFELTTEMAFHWFAHEKVDVAVIEVGLGGRLDSTNVIRPLLSVITSISFDHTALLGDTLEKIAFEKAGIIKRGVPVVVAHNPEEVVSVFEKKAGEQEAPLHRADKEYGLRVCDSSDVRIPLGSQCLDVYRLGNHNAPESLVYKNLISALGGFYIRENALCVFAGLDLLRSTFTNIDEASVYAGFRDVVKSTGLRGRWEILQEHPLCVCDTGHNEAGIRFLVTQLTTLSPKVLRIVFGVVSDKDVRTMLSLLPKEAVYYFTKAAIPRALSEIELARLAGEYGLKGMCYPSVAEAKNAALNAADPEDVIYIGGSNFVVAEIL